MPASDLVAGSLSGLVSCVLLQPLEVIKTRLQQQQRAQGVSTYVQTQQIIKTYHIPSSLLTIDPSKMS
jgi:hypothetical protein